LFALWVAGAWLVDMRLPVLHAHSQMTAAPAEALFPFVALMLVDAGASQWQAAIAIAAFAIALLTIAFAAMLAAWLAWRGVTRPALRNLVLAMALGAIASGWFWFVRSAPPAFAAGHVAALDYAFAFAWFAAACALQTCFSAYPEPISHALLRNAGNNVAESYSGVRSGEGVWRFWSWLPAERYGRYGRTTAPELRGLARLLRSRELLWGALYVTVGLLAWRYASFDAPQVLRVGLFAAIAFLALCIFDPVFLVRIQDTNLEARFSQRAPAALLDAEMAVRQWFVGWRGLLVALGIALGFTAAWHEGGIARAIAITFLVCWGVIVTGNAMSLLYMNWRSGNAEQRRAIAWIFLGTASVFVLWSGAMTIASIAVLLTNSEWFGKVNGCALVLGPVLTVLAFVLSLWASILHRGSFDPALALRKGAGVAALGIVLTALFVAVEGAASSLIVTHMGMPSESGPVIAGTVVALGFKPLRERIENRVEQAMLRLLPAEAVAEGERRVCAVLFADLSGYTRLSETDEKEAMTLAAILHRHARRSAAAHGGRVVKTIGDAVLCVFDRADQALAAAADLSRGFRDEAARLELEALPLHSGLHVGEVVTAHDGDVFGASVNLAARLQSLAGANELIASNSAAGAVAASMIPAEPLPGQRFKNIAEPVDCLRLRLL
jgi:class 3 adenylate cyclase